MRNCVGGQCAQCAQHCSLLTYIYHKTVEWVREVRSCKRNEYTEKSQPKSVLSYTDPTHDDTMCLRLPTLFHKYTHQLVTLAK